MSKNQVNILVALGILIVEGLGVELVLNGNENLGPHLAGFTIYFLLITRGLSFYHHWKKEYSEFEVTPYRLHSVIALVFPWLTFLAEPLKGKARYYFDLVCFGLFFVVLFGLIIAAFVVPNNV